MAGAIFVVSGFKFEFEFKSDLSDWFTFAAVVVAIYSSWRAYLYHRQQLQPFINFLHNFDSNSGTVTFSVENVGGSYAKINKAYFRFFEPYGGYKDFFPLIDHHNELRNVPNLVQEANSPDRLVITLFKLAHETFIASQFSEETKINVTYDSYRFTENNAIGKGEKSDILTMQHDILKKDSKYPNFAHALFAHSKMLELFIEYEDVTGNKFYIPSKEAFFESEQSLKQIADDSLKVPPIKNQVQNQNTTSMKINIKIPKDILENAIVDRKA